MAAGALGHQSFKVSVLVYPETCRMSLRKRWVIIPGGFLFLGISELHLLTWAVESWEIYGLNPEAWIWDVVERLWRLFCSLDYPVPFVYVGSNNTVTGILEHINCNCMVVATMINSVRVHLIFCSVSSMRRKCSRKSKWILQVNKWLHSWCK